MPLKKGQRFGDYTIGKMLGAGGMAIVYQATSPTHDAVAIKVMADNLTMNQSAVTRFQQEAHLSAQLYHTNIVRILDYGEVNGQFYLANEFMAQGSIQDKLDKHRIRFSLQQVWHIISSIASGLDYLHTQNIVHRDLKLANVLVDEGGRIAISDFGIARGTGTEQRITNITHAVIGTPQYLAPEQTQSSSVDKRADLYALGVIAYLLTVGQYPFEGETIFDYIRLHRESSPPTPTSIRPQLPHELDRVLLKALEKDPNKRYQKASDFAEDFGRSIANSKPVHVTTNIVKPNEDNKETVIEDESVEWATLLIPQIPPNDNNPTITPIPTPTPYTYSAPLATPNKPRSSIVTPRKKQEKSTLLLALIGVVVVVILAIALVLLSFISNLIANSQSAPSVVENTTSLIASPTALDNELPAQSLLVSTSFAPTATLTQFVPTATRTLAPSSPTPALVGCSDTLSPLFSMNETGLLTAGEGNRIRSQPNRNASIIGRIPPNYPFWIVGGVECANGFMWYYVNHKGYVGWTALADDKNYYAERSPMLAFDKETQTNISFTYRQFERGIMIRVGLRDSSLNPIYVLILDGDNAGKWAVFLDAWQRSDSDPSAIAPSGLFTPTQHFGSIWGKNPQVQSWLGWATAPEDRRFVSTWEYTYGDVINNRYDETGFITFEMTGYGTLFLREANAPLGQGINFTALTGY